MSVADRAARLIGVGVVEAGPLAGGDLSAVYALTLADGRRVIAKAGDLAAREAAMLRAITATGAPAPALLAVDSDLFVMERLEAGGSLTGAWVNLAQVLAILHQAIGDRYGWPDDHAFGAIVIANGPVGDWPTFWADRRLRCHLPYVPRDLAARIERLADSLAARLPAAPPASLLHGDLWGGNIMVSGSQISGLIDPACYYGDREVDAAMLTLFDHPPPDFFEALGLEPGWRERQPIYRLWPLLVHLRLFGEGYSALVSSALRSLGA